MIGKYETYEQYEKALNNRLRNLIECFNKIQKGEHKYPFRAPVLGFTCLEIKNKDEHIGRIKELCNILNVDIPNLLTKVENSTIERKL